jgi:GLPGLI family protein
MKKYKLLFILFLVSQTIFCQKNNILVEYTFDNGHFKNLETLIANNKDAIKITGSLTFENDSIIEGKSDNNYIINQKLIKIGKKSIFSSLENKYVHIIMPYSDNKTYFVKDELINLDWKLVTNENLTISGYKCSKAILNFRGRDYVAYYTTEIPISFGPWKFKNLPGLILYIYSETGSINFSWKAQKIIHPYVDFKKSIKWNDKEKTITLKDYVAIREAENEKRSKIIDSRTSQGSKLVKTEIKRLGLEFIYEWEEETKEN